MDLIGNCAIALHTVVMVQVCNWLILFA